MEKGLRVVGIPSERFRKISGDPMTGLDPDEFAAVIAGDRKTGLQPFFVVGTAGTTATLSFDPVEAIAKICREHGLWLHVDAAYAGVAAVCPELRFVNKGLEYADSYCCNPRQWLLVNFDCSCLYVADRSALLRALRVTPEYLKNAASDSAGVIDYRDWQVPLGRRSRALKLWSVLCCYGAEGLRRHIRKHVSLARVLVDLIVADPRFELSVPASLALVCFREKGATRETESFLMQCIRADRYFSRMPMSEGTLRCAWQLAGCGQSVCILSRPGISSRLLRVGEMVESSWGERRKRSLLCAVLSSPCVKLFGVFLVGVEASRNTESGKGICAGTKRDLREEHVGEKGGDSSVYSFSFCGLQWR